MSAVHAFDGDGRVANLRVPPHSIDAEQAVLGGLMLRESAWHEIADKVREEDFYRHDHRLIFRAIAALIDAREPVDVVTVGDMLGTIAEARGDLPALQGYVIELASITPSAANIAAYAKIVRDKSALRALIDAGAHISSAALEPGDRSADEIIAECTARLAALSQSASRDSGLRMIRSGLAEAMRDITARQAGDEIDVMPPPWASLEHVLPGLEPTDFCVIAGRPGMGKTVAGVQWAEHVARTKGKPVAIFSLEMSRVQLTTRMLSMKSGVQSHRLRVRDGMEREDWEAIDSARAELAALPLAIDDTASVTIDAIKARAARMHAKVGGLGLIVIDYLQLIEGSGKPDRRVEEMSAISRGCKLLAKELHCPVIALAQLNRSLEQRADKRPMMSDLRESGAIEQDADVIVFLYRDDYYSKDDCNAPGVAEAIVAKQRNGPCGTAYLRHELDRFRFADYHGQRPVYAKPRASLADDDGVGVERRRSRTTRRDNRAEAAGK